MSIFAHAREQFQTSIKFYAADLMAMTEEQFTEVPMGKARRACDFSYEVVVVNERQRRRMIGEDPGPWPFEDSWAVCPDHLRTRAAMVEALQAGAAKVINSFEKIGEKKGLQEIDAPGGKNTPVQMLMFINMHTMYHDAQLNYLQALHGDDKMNWPD